MFVGDLLETVAYNDHFHAYQINIVPQPSFRVFSQADLKDHHVLSLYQPFHSPSTFMLPLKYYVLDEFDVGSE